MRLHILGIVTGFTVLSALRSLTHAVPAPFDVSVKCDSYGVVVEWMAAGLSEQAEFLLELKPDFGKNISVSTKYPRYNISDLLLDTAYNQYFVKVKARDGEHESEFAESQIFSFNYLKEVNITCGLEFPTVNLFPRDGKLFVEFINPLHLYRNTPALRNLRKTETLEYTVATLQSHKISHESACSIESEKCESSVSFPEEQEKYCIKLLGRIRQTCVWETEPYCHEGTLNPGPPITVYLIPVLVGFAVFLALTLATVFLVKEINKKIKEQHLTKLPLSLKTKLTYIPVNTPENPNVEPAVNISTNSTYNFQESITQSETTTNSDITTDCTEDEDVHKSSGSSELEASSSQERLYGTGAELSSSDLSTGYDRPHTLIEMSPEDKVKNYGS
ncbi:interferon gamma receptor 1 [Pangasianodon hypophthalmus]|uniref:interferon gamma receptor 1 n=1 Tax=Pangasianodon hypophthalmus TaxID=310915 RepID=UPI002307B094|nr:interferon gamma receptor 1 [Pangasianodon hypophthalmus]